MVRSLDKYFGARGYLLPVLKSKQPLREVSCRESTKFLSTMKTLSQMPTASRMER